MFLRKTSVCALAAAIAVTASVSTQAETSASVGISSMYLLRGLDLDTPQVWGSATYSQGAFSATGWISSLGEDGYELDVVPNYVFEISDNVAVDVGAIIYKYEDNDWDSYTDLNVGLSVGPVYVYYAYTIGEDYEDVDWNYLSVSGSAGSFSGTLGYDAWDDGEVDGDYVHLDLTWSYNDNLSFTVSKIIGTSGSYGTAIEEGYSDDVQFLVGYEMSIE